MCSHPKKARKDENKAKRTKFVMEGTMERAGLAFLIFKAFILSTFPASYPFKSDSNLRIFEGRPGNQIQDPFSSSDSGLWKSSDFGLGMNDHRFPVPSPLPRPVAAPVELLSSLPRSLSSHSRAIFICERNEYTMGMKVTGSRRWST